jgi:hypothetical protein
MKKIGKLLITLLLHAEAQGLSLQPSQDPATQTRTHGLGKRDKTLHSNMRKAPGGINPLLQGLRGYTQRVRSRVPTKASSTKHYPARSCRKPSLVKTSERALTLSPRLGGYCRVPQKGVP